jgi:hypothetical protein
MDTRRKLHGKTPRVALAAAVATGTVAVFAALGGAGLAQNSISAAQYQYGEKTTVCHKGKKSISIGNAAVAAHLRHGDTVGSCASVAAKAKKAKAAKVKAAKAKAAKAEKQATPAAEKSQSDKPNPGRGKGK